MKPARVFLVALFFLLLAGPATSQSEDNALNQRLDQYMHLSKTLEYEKLMEFIYPKLFDIAPKSAIIETMRQTFESNEMRLGFDSMAVLTVGASFVHKGTEYRKVDYSMVLRLQLTDTSNLKDTTFINIMNMSLSGSFAGASVRFDRPTGSWVISGTDFMIAIKEKDQPWMFIGNEKNKLMVETLFPPEVIKKFSLL